MSETKTNNVYNLPYNIGDKLYCINKRNNKIDEMIIASIIVDKDGLMVKVNQPRIGIFDLPIREAYIQKTVFTSYADAERYILESNTDGKNLNIRNN